jgi:hypothetical protein
MATTVAVQDDDMLWLPFIATIALTGLAFFFAVSGTDRRFLFALCLALAALVQLAAQLRVGYALRGCLIASYSRSSHPRLYWFHVILAALCPGGFAYVAITSVR